MLLVIFIHRYVKTSYKYEKRKRTENLTNYSFTDTKNISNHTHSQNILNYILKGKLI